MEPCTVKARTVRSGAARWTSTEGTAVGTYNDTLEETGWGILDIASGYGAETADVDIMYAAGYMEGYLTARLVALYYTCCSGTETADVDIMYAAGYMEGYLTARSVALYLCVVVRGRNRRCGYHVCSGVHGGISHSKVSGIIPVCSGTGQKPQMWISCMQQGTWRDISQQGQWHY